MDGKMKSQSIHHHAFRLLPVILSILFLLLFAGLLSAQEVTITVMNPSPSDRTLETVEVPWSQISNYLPLSGQSSVEVTEKNKEVFSQLIDLDGNGIPDQLVFQSSFRKGEEKFFVVRVGPEKPEIKSVTNAKYILPRKDVAWENDRIAYRIYGGPLAGTVFNGLDVWTKRVRYQIIDKWYDGDSLKGKKRISYHVDHGEGADMFDVVYSLGAGACAPWINGKIDQPGLFTTYKIIATGPVRAMFTVWYEKDTSRGLPFKEEATYTLDAGMNLNRIEVTYTGLTPEQPLAIAAGLVKRKNTTQYADEKKSWLSLWGHINEDSTNGSLGIGIVIPGSSFKELNEDKDQYLIIANAESGKPYTYYAGAGWTRSGDFGSVDDWNGYLSQCAQNIRYPLKVTIGTAK